MRPCYILLPWPVKNLAPERSLGINRHGTIRPGFLWAVGVSGHFLVGLGESVFSLIRHWAGMGTGWRSLWSQTTWKDLNGLEWRWITLRDFYLRLQESEITKPCLRLLKATTFLVSFLFFFFFFSSQSEHFSRLCLRAPTNWHCSLEVPFWNFSFMQCSEMAVY